MKESARSSHLLALASAAVSLALGFVVLEVLVAGIDLFWIHLPETWGSTPVLYVFALPVIAAVLIYAIRRFLPDAGHSPLQGFTVHALDGRAYGGVITSIALGLLGGVVLGPEVALVATGAAVGTAIARSHPEAKKIIRAGVAGAVLALFVGPVTTGSLNLGQQDLEVEQLAWAIPVAAITAGVVAITRWIGTLIARRAEPAPHLTLLLVGALIMAAAASVVEVTTGESAAFVLTSGEQLITKLPALTTVSTVVVILIAKALAYSVSLGSGFRGGPFFPAMFIGAAVGLLGALLIPDGPTTGAAIAVGVIAGIVATMRMSWKAVVILGAIVAFLMGGWGLIVAGVVGAVVARAIPRWEDRVTHSRG